MTPAIYALSIETIVPLLRTFDHLLDKTAEHASRVGRDPAAWTDARLAPDMFPLASQVKFTCDQARTWTALLLGTAPPAIADHAADLAGLRARIAATVAHFEAIPAAAFEGAAERRIVLPLQGDLVLDIDGLRFVRDWMLPQLYFHAVTAYGILRHHGVELGIRDYMGHLGSAIRRA